MSINLEEIKAKYNFPGEQEFGSYLLDKEEFRWLIETAELTEDLIMLLKRLIFKVNREKCAHWQQLADAFDYLERKELMGSIMRKDSK